MNKYIGVKLVQAEPMTDLGFHCRPSTLPPHNFGYFNNNDHIHDISFEPREGYQVIYPGGYVSWSPKEVFEEAYKPTDGMTFGLAVEAVKKGFKVAREGWNGKGMFIYYIPAASYPAQTEVAKKQFGDMVQYNAYLAIKNVNGTVSTWVPSVNDVLSEDWRIVE